MTLGEIVLFGMLIGLLLTAAALAFLAHAQKDRDTFRKKWPPMTDDEFLAACPPGTDPLIALRVHTIPAYQLGIA